jgi:hypothetical protein
MARVSRNGSSPAHMSIVQGGSASELRLVFRGELRMLFAVLLACIVVVRAASVPEHLPFNAAVGVAVIALRMREAGEVHAARVFYSFVLVGDGENDEGLGGPEFDGAFGLQRLSDRRYLIVRRDFMLPAPDEFIVGNQHDFDGEFQEECHPAWHM